MWVHPYTAKPAKLAPDLGIQVHLCTVESGQMKTNTESSIFIYDTTKVEESESGSRFLASPDLEGLFTKTKKEFPQAPIGPHYVPQQDEGLVQKRFHNSYLLRWSPPYLLLAALSR